MSSSPNPKDFVPAPPERTAIVLPKAKWRRRRFERGTPKDALTWKSAKRRAKLMFAWQCAVMAKFESSSRVLRVAWLLHSLFQKEGYAYATDAYIGETLDLDLRNVQRALVALENAGAIVRASSFVRKKAQRRIWPSAKLIPATVAGTDTGYGDPRDTGYGSQTDSIGKVPTRKTSHISSIAEAARRDAERRDRRRCP